MKMLAVLLFAVSASSSPVRQRIAPAVAVAALSFRLAAFLPSFAVGQSSSPLTEMKKEGFEDTLLFGNLRSPIDFTFTPQGPLLYTVKNAKMYYVENPQEIGPDEPKEILDLTSTTCTNGARGFNGVAVHPRFGTENRYVYLFHNWNKNDECEEDKDTGPVNVLSRFVMNDDDNTIDVASQTILFETAILYKDYHNAGDVEFAKDGHLYVTIGDAALGRRVSTSQDPSRLDGKILRLTEDGDIPHDNPYVGHPDAVRCHEAGRALNETGEHEHSLKCLEIYALGLRNPYRFAFDPNTSNDEVRFFVNDVGQADWEMIHEGGRDFPLSNYGWPLQEGPCDHGKTEPRTCNPQIGFDDPIYWFPHHPQDGGAITGGAFVPNGVWPEEYDGSYVFVDYVNGEMYLLREEETGGNRVSDDLVTNPPVPPHYGAELFAVSEKVISMRFGPHGDSGQGQALYYLTRGQGENKVQGFKRIAYVGNANRSPSAVAVVNDEIVDVGQILTFNGSGSYDPDGDALTYRWNFGDGSPISSESNPTHSYEEVGTFEVTLTVTDPGGKASADAIRIDVGNSAPVPVIDDPPPGTTFSVGDVITVRGHANDTENGVLDDSFLSWEVRKHHNTHFHPYLAEGTIGNDIPLQAAPEPEDFLASLTSHLEIILTATDAHGLSATATREVFPNLVRTNFETAPSGLVVLLDGYPVTTPGINMTMWDNQDLNVYAPDQRGPDGSFYEFESWSDGGAQSHDVITKRDTQVTLVATFVNSTGPTANLTASATAKASSPQSDDFSASSLDGVLWNTAGGSDVTISVANGTLKIDTPIGSNHDLKHNNQRAGVVWQDVTDADVAEMELEVKLGPTPGASNDDPLDVTVREQMVGIYVRGVESGYWLRTRLHTHRNGNSKVKVERIEPGSTTRITATITIPYVPKTLKLIRNGSSYQYLYSTSDGTGFDSLSFSSDMEVAGLGLYAGNKFSKPAFQARFDSFAVTLPGTAPPTDAPTMAPSALPSFVPTSHPSSDPSSVPSPSPSNGPSSAPSKSPTAMPGVTPSARPSSVPSSAPSKSSQPSDAPSAAPSDLPSDAPSILPSRNPSVPPTSTPSVRPSDGPSRLPSDDPTVGPTSSPSAAPSDRPSKSPNQFCEPSSSVYVATPAECSVDALPALESGATPRSVLSFYVMGDTPYDSPTSDGDKECLQGQLRSLDLYSADSPNFIVHVGDFKAGSQPCLYEDFTNVRNMFTHPANALNYRVEDFFVIPGDNEWNDCDGFSEAEYPDRLDEQAATSLWRSMFAPGPDRFGTLSGTTGMTATAVERKSNRVENFAFFVATGIPNADSGIAVLGLSLVAGEVDDEEQMLIDNVEWTEAKLGEYDAVYDVRAIVIFGHHSLPSKVRDVLERLAYVDLPMMYLQGNKHDFCVERPWSNDLPHMIRLTVEDGDNADPIRVDVSYDPTNPCADHVFEVDRRLGSYVDNTNECPSVTDEDTWTESGTSPRPSRS